MSEITRAGLDTGLFRLEEVLQAKFVQIVVFHDGSFGVSARGLSEQSTTFRAICSFAMSVNFPVIRDRFIESATQLKCMFERAKLHIWRIIATALTVVTSTAKSMVIATTINTCSADYTESSVSAHIVSFYAAA